MATEVFNRIGEAEIYSEKPSFYKRPREESFDEDDDSSSEKPQKIESQSKPITEAKKEFFEHLENDSLNVDSCEKINKDGGKK